MDRLAQETKRSRAYIAAEAIYKFVALNDWQVSETKKARDAADAGGPFVSHEDMSSLAPVVGH